MVYIKMNADFISIDELAETIDIPAEQIQECIDHGLLENENSLAVYFPHAATAIKRLKLAFDLSNYGISRELKKHIIHALDFCTDDGKSSIIKNLLFSYDVDPVLSQRLLERVVNE